MRGTGLRAVTTYPTISRQDKVSDFYFNCLCGTGRLLGATGGREGLSRTPWRLAIFMLSSWQCLPSQSSNCVQLLSTILPRGEDGLNGRPGA